MRTAPNVGSRLAALALAGLAAIGCGSGDGLPREPISGTVTFDGKPLENGLIQFQPASEKEGIAAGGIIKGGKFSVPRDEGPVPGTYLVMIFAKGDSTEEPPPAENEMPGDRPPPPRPTGMIPLRYNLETELRKEIKAGGPNEFTFTLEK